MLIARPSSTVAGDLTKVDFTIVVDGHEVTELVAWLPPGTFHQHALFSVAGDAYRASRKGLMGTDFVLEKGDWWTLADSDQAPARLFISGVRTVIARAGKRLFRRRFETALGSHNYTLAKSYFSRRYVLRSGNRLLGHVDEQERSRYRHSTTFVAALPPEISLPEQIFVLWLVMLMKPEMRPPPK